MPVYRKCGVCQGRVLVGQLCECEVKKRQENYKVYKQRCKMNEQDASSQEFYNSGQWLRCRDAVATHQFGIDLIEWDKGNVIASEMYHHIVEVKSDKAERLNADNIMGLTQLNHMRVHALMNKSEKDNKLIKKYLLELIIKFNEEYYD